MFARWIRSGRKRVGLALTAVTAATTMGASSAAYAVPLSAAPAWTVGAEAEAGPIVGSGGQFRSDLCQLGQILHVGGPEVKKAAQAALAGSDADRRAAADKAPLSTPFWAATARERAERTKYRDERAQRQKGLEDQLKPYSVFGPPPEFDAEIAAFVFRDEPSQDQWNGPRPQVAGQASVDRAAQVVAERKSTDQAVETFGPWVVRDRRADDIRMFLLYGGFAAVAPAKGSVEARTEVEALKVRWAGCDSAGPYDPNRVLGDVVAAAETEWRAELDAQAQPRAEIVAAELQAAQEVRAASDAMFTAIGQAWVADKILATQRSWQQPGSPQPTAELRARATKDLADSKTKVAAQLEIAKRASGAATTAADKAEAGRVRAAQIATAAGTPAGRGLAYSLQSVQVAKGSAAAARAAAKTTETTLRAVQATAADSAALLSLARTQALALRTDFLKAAADEAAAQAKAAADTSAALEAETARLAEVAKLRRGDAEKAEAFAKVAADDANRSRLAAERERDKATSERQRADVERNKAKSADERAQQHQQEASAARLRADETAATAGQKADAAGKAEAVASKARDEAVAAERRRDALVARANADEALAAADEGTSSAQQSRSAANQSRAAANTATSEAASARSAANTATDAAIDAREAATRAGAAAGRSRASADATQASAATAHSEARAANRAAAEAIDASEAAGTAARAAEAEVKKAEAATAKARDDAAVAREQADKAQQESAVTTGHGYAAAEAATASRDASLAAAVAGSEAIGIGTPYRGVDSSAGMAVLVGQAAKSLAEQQAAAAAAKSTEATKAAGEARKAAERADGNAKAAAQAAANAAADTARAHESVKRSRASAGAAARDAAAATNAATKATDHDRQAAADAFLATFAANTAESEAKAADAAATAAEKDAASARAAADTAERDAAAARASADQADKDATRAEQSAANARAHATEAQDAATRTEQANRAKAEEVALGPNGPAGEPGLIAEPVDVRDDIPENLKCVQINVTQCRMDVPHHLTGKMVYKVRTCPDPATTNCPGQYTEDYVGTVPFDTTITKTVTVEYWEITKALWTSLAQAMISDFVGCAHGDKSDCAWAAAILLGPTAVKYGARGVVALRNAMRTGVGIEEAVVTLRASEVEASVLVRLEAELEQTVTKACTTPVGFGAHANGAMGDGNLTRNSRDPAIHTTAPYLGHTPVLARRAPACLRVALGNGLYQYPDGSIRNALGKFAGTTSTRVGAAAERAAWDDLAVQGLNVERSQVAVRGNGGQLRYYDGVINLGNKRAIGIEVKNGGASLTPEQRAFDDWVKSGNRPRSVGIFDNKYIIEDVLVVNIP